MRLRPAGEPYNRKTLSKLKRSVVRAQVRWVTGEWGLDGKVGGQGRGLDWRCVGQGRGLREVWSGAGPCGRAGSGRGVEEGAASCWAG